MVEPERKSIINDSPLKIHNNKRRPHSSIKQHLVSKTLFKDDQEISQDKGQDSNIIIGDSKHQF